MGSPTEYYVDPSIGTDSGSGTLGDPWGRASGSVIEWAVNNITRDATNGDRINVKAGAYDTLTSNMNFTAIYGSGTASAPLYIQGYTSAAGDGGIGQVDGTSAAYSMSNTSMDFAYFIDLELKDCPITSDNNCVAVNIWSYSSAGTGVGIQFDQSALILNCRIETVGNALDVTGDAYVADCYIECSGSGTSNAVSINNAANVFERNIVVCTAAGPSGIFLNSGYATTSTLRNNSILSTVAGTGSGIEASVSSADGLILNNLIEGFSGTGGHGINWNSMTDTFPFAYAGNAVYDCATAYSTLSGEITLVEEDNESLAGTPYAKSGAVSYANRATYFAPADVGNVRTGAYGGLSTLSKGAVQYAGGGATLASDARIERLK